MVTESIRVSRVFPLSPQRLYEAWLDSGEHARFTGGEASIEANVGGAHSAWDGYIWGRIIELEPGRRIVQTWRTSEFPEGSEDSQLEILFEPEEGGTRLTLIHTEIPEGQSARYESSWEDFYFEPMAKYFGSVLAAAAVAAKAVGDGARARVAKAGAKVKVGVAKATAKVKVKVAKARAKVKVARAKAKLKVRVGRAKAASKRAVRRTGRQVSRAVRRTARTTARKVRAAGRKLGGPAKKAGRQAARSDASSRTQGRARGARATR